MSLSRGEMISLTVATIGCALGLSLSIFDKIPQKWIDIDTQALERIGSVSTTSGRVERKLLNDSIWLQVSEKQGLYAGDRVRTAAGSSTVLELNTNGGDNQVTLPENTYVRIYKKNERIHLQIAAGEVEVEAPPEADPINTNVRTRVASNSPPGEGAPTNEETSATSDASNAPQVAAGTKNPFQKDLDGLLPYPSDASAVFHNRRGEVIVHPIQKCLAPCAFKITAGQKVLEQSFQAEESPEIKMQLSDFENVDVTWELTSEGQKITGTFALRLFSPKALDEAMKKKQKTEVVY